MARIRTLKPEFPQSETVGKLSRDARLLFILLFTVADDDGRARAASRLIASLLYPHDADVPALIDGWLDELEVNNNIVRYQHEGSTYLVIVNWLKHQKIDRPTPSRLPAPPEGSTDDREPSRTLAADLGPGPTTLDRGAGPSPARLASQISDEWKPSTTTCDSAKGLGLSEDDIAKSTRRFVLHHRAKGTQRADWDAQFELWVSDDAKKLGRAPSSPAVLATSNHQIEDTRWAPIRSVLLPMVGRDPYASWYAALTIAEVTDKAITFLAPTKFHKTKLEDDCWGDRLRDVCAVAYPGRAVSIEVRKTQEKAA